MSCRRVLDVATRTFSASCKRNPIGKQNSLKERPIMEKKCLNKMKNSSLEKERICRNSRPIDYSYVYFYSD